MSFFFRVSQPHEYMQSPLDSAVGTRLFDLEVDIKLLSITLILVLKILDVYIKSLLILFAANINSSSKLFFDYPEYEKLDL